MGHKRLVVKFAITVALIVGSLTAMGFYAGFKHEVVKFKTMLASMVLTLLFQYLIGDPIKFVILSIDQAWWPRRIYIPPRMTKPDTIDRIDFLKQRLASQRANLVISSRYRNWHLNERYKVIAQDVLIYGLYFLCLMIMVLVAQDEISYHNTRIITTLFWENHTDYYGLKEVYFLNQLFDFIESTLVIAFNANSTVGGSGGAGWVHAEQTVMLGVVRLRQVRVLDPKFGLEEPEFSEMYYMPDWQLPYRRLTYADKYWRVFEPWIPITISFEFLDGLLMNFNHVGYLNTYPELVGYVSLLARSTSNTKKILDYLIEYHWLTLNTSAVFIDFTLYNVDVNLFTICTLRVEKTPFGGIMSHVEVDSVKLMEDVDQMPYTVLLPMLIYIVVVIQFSQTLIIRLWYEPKLLKSVWNKLDLVICTLNLVVVVMVVVRESLVSNMMKKVAGTSKMEFIDFRRPSRLHQMTTIMVGFLICITTLRLWRVLQFSSMFQLFTRTLYLAWTPMASTAMVIVIFLVGYCFAVVTINGNYSSNFNRFIKAMAMCMCYAFGFSNQVDPSELFHGGRWLGILLYAILVFVIAVLLVNVFVSLINYYFTVSKGMRDLKHDNHINFFQFLRVEYPNLFSCFHKLPCFRGHYVRNSRTVAENVKVRLDALDANQAMKLRQRQGYQTVEHHQSELLQDIKYRDLGEKLMNVGKILTDQLTLLERLLFDDEGKEMEQDDDDELEEGREDPRSTKKKWWERSKSKTRVETHEPGEADV